MARSKSKATLVSEISQQESERDKLIKLVHVWRSKYEKLYSSTRNVEETISKLKQENEQLKRDKEIISSGLMQQMESDRVAAETRIAELLTIADTAAKKNELETRDLKTKLRRLEVETQPIIDIYKERDDKLQKIVTELNERNVELENKLRELKTTLQHSEMERTQEITKLKTSFEKSALRSKMFHAAKVELITERIRAETVAATELTIRSQVEAEYANRVKARVMLDAATVMSPRHNHSDDCMPATKSTMVSETELALERSKWEEERKMRDDIVQEMRVEIETVRQEIELMEQKNRIEVMELNAKIDSLVFEKRRVVEDFTQKLFALKKKVELGRLRTQQREETIKKLQDAIKEASGTLESRRHRSRCRDVRTSLTVRELSKQLIVTIRETKSIEKALNRIDILRKRESVFEADDMLRLEVLYTMKISEVSRLRRLIRTKLVDKVYQRKEDHLDSTLQPNSLMTEVDEEDIVFLKSGYGSYTDSDLSTSHGESDEDVQNNDVRIAKRNRHSKEVIRLPLEMTDRTSWLLAPKHYTTLNMM